MSSNSLPDLATATQTTATTSQKPAASTSGNRAATITGSGTTGQASGAISITGTAATTGGGLPSGLPKLSGAIQPVTASVPPTKNAPFMQQSTLPDGTVFIIVGAILGFMAFSVLLWRGLVAWSLHRSVKRASEHQNMADTKALFRTPAAPVSFYKYSDNNRDSTISLSGLGGGKGGKKGARPTTAPGGPSTSSLFFSPTAGAAGAGGLGQPGNRGSSYLPAGYYASGSSNIAGGNNSVHVGGSGHQPAISLSNLGPQSQGYSRARSMGPSPPDSPLMRGQGNVGGGGMGNSSSTLNLNGHYGGRGGERPPSAYLEDLFDGEGVVLSPPQVPRHGPPRAGSTSPRRY
ncbi:hypothetical protein WAI453_002326 [Rhynchosporium graminicola]|uniref:CSI2 protein n=1 Tax=Rhynchosporium graminicola TaxID=2792576 RepID=A0A1E1LBR3_9HELO|nr:uncharacterized protein RCO7_09618 [Rhynchosporium commune]